MAKDTLDKRPASTDSGVAHTNGLDNMTGSGMSGGFPVTAAIAGEDMEITHLRRSRARLIVPVVLVLTVAAAEAAIGLAILVVFYRNRGSIAVEDINLMRG